MEEDVILHLSVLILVQTMPVHDEVFSHSTPFQGELPANFGIDFLGAKTRKEFIAGLFTHPTSYSNPLPYRLVAVEAEPLVFSWMGMHFEDNAIDSSKHRLTHAATSDKPGDVLLYIGGPRGGAWDCSPDDWYGQCMAKDYDASGQYEDDGVYQGFKVRLHKSGWRSINIPSVTLKRVVADLDRVDLLDMDIEGQDCPSSVRLLTKWAPRLNACI